MSVIFVLSPWSTCSSEDSLVFTGTQRYPETISISYKSGRPAVQERQTRKGSPEIASKEPFWFVRESRKFTNEMDREGNVSG